MRLSGVGYFLHRGWINLILTEIPCNICFNIYFSFKNNQQNEKLYSFYNNYSTYYKLDNMPSKLLNQNTDRTKILTMQYHFCVTERFRVQYIVILHDSTGNFNIIIAWNITTYLFSDLVAEYITIYYIILYCIILNHVILYPIICIILDYIIPFYIIFDIIMKKYIKI